MGHFNTNANKVNTNKQVVRHVIGSDAIAVNDLLCVGERGKIWPVKSKTFGTVAKAGTEVFKTNIQRDRHAGSNAQGYLELAEAFFDPATLNTFVASVNSLSGNSKAGIYLDKFNSKGEVVKHTMLLTDSNATKYRPIIKELTNGNLLVVYRESGANAYFQIFNKNLDVVVATTSMGLIVPLYVLALSGGGFAVFANASGNTVVTFSSYNNAGAAVVTPVTLTTNAFDLAAIELSNGNIGICLTNAPFSATSVGVINLSGSFISPLAVISQLVANPTAFVSISAINGFFCCSVELTTRVCVAVFNNSGQLKNFNNTFSYGVTGMSDIRQSMLVNDGAAFWVLVVNYDATNSVGVNFNVMYLPTSGLNTDNKLHVFNYNTTFEIPAYSSLAGILGSSILGFYKHGTILFAWLNTIVLLDISNGTVNSLKSIEHDPEGLSQPLLPRKLALVDVGDGCYFWTGVSAAGIKKYVDTNIVGTSKVAIGAGNEDTPIDLTLGSGSFNINPIPGETADFNYADTYDKVVSSVNHYTGLIDQTTYSIQNVGKSGTIFNNSVLFNN